jgi:hypothetical protein
MQGRAADGESRSASAAVNSAWPKTFASQAQAGTAYSYAALTARLAGDVDYAKSNGNYAKLSAGLSAFGRIWKRQMGSWGELKLRGSRMGKNPGRGSVSRAVT